MRRAPILITKVCGDCVPMWGYKAYNSFISLSLRARNSSYHFTIYVILQSDLSLHILLCYLSKHSPHCNNYLVSIIQEYCCPVDSYNSGENLLANALFNKYIKNASEVTHW